MSLGIVVRNQGSSPVFDVDLEWIPSTVFKIDRLKRWSKLGSAPFAPVNTLGAGEEVLVRTRLRALESAKGSSPAVRVTWRDTRDAEVSSQFVTMPPITIEGRWSRIQEFWPITLPIFGTLLIALLGWRFTLRVERQKEHLETFLSMQSKVLEIAEKHYLPIGSAVKTMRGRLRDFFRATSKLESLPGSADPRQREAAENERDRTLALAFAAFMLLHHRDYQLTHKVGGWVLLNRVGEEAVDALWECFREEVLERFDKIEMGRMIEAVGTVPTLSGMITAFGRQETSADPEKAVAVARWQNLLQRFQTWVTSDRAAFDARMRALEAFADVLHLETNRFYAPLYGPKERFPGKDDKLWIERLVEASQELAHFQHSTTFSDCAARLKEYCAKIEPDRKLTWQGVVRMFRSSAS